MTRYFLGVDIGSTKTHALIADEFGQALGFGEGGAGNHEVVGYDGLAETLRTTTERALAGAGLALEQISGAGFGVAGYDWKSEREPTLRVIDETLGLQVPRDAVNDALIGLIAGARDGWGVALEAGTGCNCYGRDRHGRIGNVTGTGWTMDEAAGAYQVVDAAIHRISREWSRRGPATALTPAFMAYVGARDLDDLIEGLCQERYALTAAAAPLVFKVASEGDPIAREVIAWAGRELADLAIGVMRQLDLEQEATEIVLVGSLFNGGPLLTEPLCTAIHAVAPRAWFTRLTVPPVVGAVLLGMEQAGLPAASLRVQLIQTTQELLQNHKAPESTEGKINSPRSLSLRGETL